MRELYIILSVVGWAWCLGVLAFLFFRLRTDARRGRNGPGGRGDDPDHAPGDNPGAEEVRA